MTNTEIIDQIRTKERDAIWYAEQHAKMVARGVVSVYTKPIDEAMAEMSYLTCQLLNNYNPYEKLKARKAA